MKEEKYIPSNKAQYVRKKIFEHCKDHCFDLTSQHIETVLELSKEHDEFVSAQNGSNMHCVEKVIKNDEKEWEEELPLLTIELQNETSIPKVFYKGEEITNKINISFDWETETEIMGGLSYAIEHTVDGKGYPVTNRIERRVKGHAGN